MERQRDRETERHRKIETELTVKIPSFVNKIFIILMLFLIKIQNNLAYFSKNGLTSYEQLTFWFRAVEILTDGFRAPSPSKCFDILAKCIQCSFNVLEFDTAS
jgi:hypothetical protein